MLYYCLPSGLPQNSPEKYQSIPYALAHCQKPISQCVMYVYILSLSVYCHACIVTVVCACSTTVLSVVLFGDFGHYLNTHLLTNCRATVNFPEG